MDFTKKITKDEINELPVLTFPGKIQLVVNKQQYINAIRLLKKEDVIGFDTESRPSFKKGESYGICLLQLSTKDTAFLFRLNKIPFDGELKDLMADESVKKVGVAVHDDIKGLIKINSFTPGGFIELADYAKTLKIKTLGLRSLAAIFMGKRLIKKTKLSNWEAPRLTTAQLNYAATDAWVGLELYYHLQKFIQE